MADLQRRVIIFSLFTFCFTFFQGLGFKIFFFFFGIRVLNGF